MHREILALQDTKVRTEDLGTLPADVASMMDFGTSLMSRRRRPVTARIMKRIPSTHTAARAV